MIVKTVFHIECIGCHLDGKALLCTFDCAYGMLVWGGCSSVSVRASASEFLFVRVSSLIFANISITMCSNKPAFIFVSSAWFFNVALSNRKPHQIKLFKRRRRSGRQKNRKNPIENHKKTGAHTPTTSSTDRAAHCDLGRMIMPDTPCCARRRCWSTWLAFSSPSSSLRFQPS